MNGALKDARFVRYAIAYFRSHNAPCLFSRFSNLTRSPRTALFWRPVSATLSVCSLIHQDPWTSLLGQRGVIF